MTSRRGHASKKRVQFTEAPTELAERMQDEKVQNSESVAWDTEHNRPADIYCPPEHIVRVRKVGQPNHALLPGAPTFQWFVAQGDQVRRPGTSAYLKMDYLRDEYRSAWGR